MATLGTPAISVDPVNQEVSEDIAAEIPVAGGAL